MNKIKSNKMKDKMLLIVFILIVFTTSFNRGEKINDIISKFHERRAAGILAQPRVGRTTGMSNFARLDGIAGLVNYPRVGRSGYFKPSINLNQDSFIELDEIPEFSNYHDGDLASFIRFVYQKYPHSNDEKQQQQQQQQQREFEILEKIDRLMNLEQSRRGTLRHQPHVHLFHCNDRAIERAWAFLLAPSKDSGQLEEQSAHNYPPRATGEIDRVQQNIVS